MEFYNLQNLKYVCYWVSHRISTLFNTTFTFTKYYDLTTNRKLLCTNNNNVYEKLGVDGMFNGKHMRFVCRNVSINDIHNMDFSKFSFNNYFNITKIMYDGNNITDAIKKFYDNNNNNNLTLDELLNDMVKMYLVENNILYLQKECTIFTKQFDDDTLCFEEVSRSLKISV
jgi:hypothetical protein